MALNSRTIKKPQMPLVTGVTQLLGNFFLRIKQNLVYISFHAELKTKDGDENIS